MLVGEVLQHKRFTPRSTQSPAQLSRARCSPLLSSGTPGLCPGQEPRAGEGRGHGENALPPPCLLPPGHAGSSSSHWRFLTQRSFLLTKPGVSPTALQGAAGAAGQGNTQPPPADGGSSCQQLPKGRDKQVFPNRNLPSTSSKGSRPRSHPQLSPCC